MTGSENGVVYEDEEPLGVVRLDRPARLHAFTFESIAAIRRTVERDACHGSHA